MKKSLYLLLCSILFIWASCNKDESSDLSENSGSYIVTSITGRILDESGTAVAGATISCAGKTSTTDIWGIYYLENVSVNKSRELLRITAPGKWDQITGFIPTNAKLIYVNASLNTLSGVFTINSTSGGQVALPGNVTITFPADAFVTSGGTLYTGTVQIKAMKLAPDANSFELLAPGGDFLGKKSTGENVILLSYGMTGVELTDNAGNEIKLGNNKKATISFPIVASFQSSAPATIPMWYLDEQTGYWMEEGSAVKTGNTYIGDVSHFTYWNFDDSRPYFTINGTVTDSCGTPVSTWVMVHSVSPNCGAHGLTDVNGNFSGYAPSNEPLNIYVGNYNYINSTLPPQGAGTMLTLGSPLIYEPLMIPTCHTIFKGVVVTCSNQPKIAPVLFLDSLNHYVGHTYSQPDGSFTFNSEVGFKKVISYSGVFYKSVNTYGTAGTIVNLGTLMLCDSTPMANNFQLTFNSMITGTIPISFLVSSASVIQNGSKYEITVNYADSMTQTNGVFKIITSTYSSGVYNWNGNSNTISGSLQFGNINYNITPSVASGSTTLTNTPQVGGNITGQFSGPVTLISTGFPTVTGTLSANFDIERTQ